MEAKELRIGNLVIYLTEKEDDEVIAPILSITFDDEPDENVNDIYKPIPLTEEWLVKFGFEKQDEGVFFIDWKFKKVKIRYKNDIKKYLVGMWTESDDDCAIIWLDYIHQLQNLFFALTGEELTIKE